MRILQQVCLILVVTFLAPSGVCAQSSDVVAAPPVNSCSRLEAGTGGDIKSAVRSLRVDLDHGISLIMLPGNVAVGPPYTIYLSPASDGKWSLTYAVDKGTFLPSRAFRGTVPIPAILAQRVENVWTRAVWTGAVAGAKQGKDKSLDCIVLDGMSYIFSANGRQAHVLGLNGGIPAQLVEVSDTLRIIFMDTENTGHAIGSSTGQLWDQLNRMEGDLKINSLH